MTCAACGHENPADATFCGECGASLRTEMHCSHCGHTNPADTKFCHGCGQRLAAARSVGSGAPPARAAAAPPLPASFAGGRYQVRRFLGEGGKKRVYLAHDTRLDRSVAVASIKTEGLDEAGLTRVRREAQAMGRLGSHAHIVTVHDIIDESGQPSIVQELMEGGSLTDLIRSAPEHRLDVPTALRIAAEIAGALSYAHQGGVIHRDVKPGNVWLTTDSRAKLGDFGLAVALDRTRLTEAGLMIGTVAYMPPEQALGGEITARSDLYSLGAMLYEMLTGRPPFPGEDTVSVISQHLNTPPLPPSMLNPQVPQGVETLVLRLLAKSPDERPVSAEEVITALAALATAPLTTAAAVPGAHLAPPRPRTGALRSPFVAREKELAQLKERLEDAIAGRGFLMMIVGEPGIGKTRLSEELSVHARLRGAQVLLGQCYESEGAPPYIPFVEALRQYVTARPAEALREEMGDDASDLAKLVSEIRARVPNLPPAASQEPEAERYRLLEAVSSFLVNASKPTPLVLILDDIHWADKPSLVLLQHLARRLPASRMLVVGTYRDIELDRRHPLSEVLGQLRRERLYERILVRGLDADGVHALLTARAQLTATGKTDVARPFAAALQEQTEGNPFFIEETINHLVDIGAIYLHEGRWVGDAAAIQQNIPEGVREVIGRRLSRLSDAANQALTFASVVGREFDFDVLQTLTEMDEVALLSALEEALAAQLIREHRASGGAAGGVAYRFTHALVQETLYGELSLARKQRLHLRTGRALEHARAGRLEPLVGQLAHHFYQGNDPAKAIDYARQAGTAALRVYAWEEAVRYFETALELMEESGGNEAQQAQLLERLGDIIYATGHAQERGIAFLERALAIYERLGNRARSAAVHSRLGRGLVSFFGHVDLEKGTAHLEAARAILEKDSPDSAGLAYVYIALSTVCLHTREIGKGLDYAQQALAIGERLNSRPVIANGLIFAGQLLTYRGRWREGCDSIERGWKIADEDSLPFVAFLGASFRSLTSLIGRRDPQDAKLWLRRELERPRMASPSLTRQMMLGALVDTHIVAGEITEARKISDAGIADQRSLARLQIALGDWEVAEQRLVAEIEESRSAGDLMRLSRASPLLTDLWLTRQQYDLADSVARSGFDASQREGHITSAITWGAGLVLVLVRTGRIEEAQLVLDHCLDILAKGEDWGGTAGRIAFARGLVVGAQGKWSDAEAAFDEALAVARRYGLPWDEAEVLHERARMHLDRGAPGDRRQALRLLDETIAIYQRLDAKKHIELVVADKIRAQGIDSADFQTSIDAVAAGVQREHPDLRQHAAPDGTVTILFSDIEGSTQMTERLGDQQWLHVLREHNRMVREQLAAHGGFEVKSQGDGFMIAFQSARRALHCAVAVQRAFAAYNEQHQDDLLRVRIGLHAGEAIKEADDFFGKNVILAARIAAQAQGGEILVSSLVKELTHSSGDIRFEPGRETALKGLNGTYTVHSVDWAAAPPPR
jgi:class 3 adenylate cyclase/tetratricopeptide (TPR) repeat protein